MKKNNNKLKVGLALGGGGARGLSHIGVLNILSDAGIKIDYIAGTSIGAMIGAFYAFSKNSKDIESLALSTDWKKVLTLIDPTIHQGILNGDKVKQYIKDFMGDKSFSDLQIPLAIVATDLKTAESVVFKKGNVILALRASISLPLIFKPVMIKNRILSDGGLSVPIPVDVVRDMGADIVIAVNLDNIYMFENDSDDFGFYKIANNSINILRYHLANSNVKNADFVINPKVARFGIGQFLDAKDIIKEGEKATKKEINKILKIINKNESRN